MKRPSSNHPTRHGAFALVLVLFVISVLALVAVGYLASMGQERATASAFANKARAEQSAQAGVDTAMGILKDYLRAFPDSSTVWDTAQSKNDDGTSNEGTSLYLRAVSMDATHTATDSPNPSPGNSTDTGYNDGNYVHGNNPNNADGTKGADGRHLFVLPLVSGATVKRFENKANSVRGADDMAAAGESVNPLKVKASEITNAVNLNARRNTADTTGWIGTPPGYANPLNAGGNTLPKPFAVPWVEIKQQDDSTNPPVIGRYAFWVEDESFRTNVSYAGNGSSGNIRRDNTANYRLDPTDINLLSTLAAVGEANSTSVAQSLLSVRDFYPGKIFPEWRAYMHTAELSATTANGLSFLATTQSSSLNVSRHGTQRLNLNSVVASTATAQKQFGEIVKAIAFHAPNFGQRFYRTTFTAGTPPTPSNLNSVGSPDGPTAAHATIYLNKIAANILDYIDSDSVPTVVFPSTNGDIIGQIRSDSRPTTTLYVSDGANPIWAFGKDAAPFLQEAAVRIVDAKLPGDTANIYRVNIDYYIEVWNMSTRKLTGADVGSSPDLGHHPFIRIINPPAWFADKKSTYKYSNPQVSLADRTGHSLTDTRNYGVAGGRDFDIDISGVVFPPGTVTVITTDPNFASLVPSISDTNSLNQQEAAKHFAYCNVDSAKRTYTGTIPDGCDEIRLRYDYSDSSDYKTGIIIGNDNGYIDSLAGAIPMGTNDITLPAGSTNHPIYGGYLKGNLTSGFPNSGNAPSATGDPRSNNEQINLIEHVASGSAINTADQTGYKLFDLTNGGYQIPATFGLPNIYSIAPPKGTNPWPDYYWFPGNDSSQTITNPAVLPGSSRTAVMSAQYAPGIIGNAPLTSIGQLGDIYDPARLPATNTSDITYSRGGGRSLRIGQHDDLYDGVQNSPSSEWAAWRLTDFFSINDNIEQPGLININGLARDNGTALLAAFKGFNFQPTTADYTDANFDPMIHGDPTLAGLAYDNSYGLKNLINDIIQHRLAPTDPTQISPFFERGEISETPLLNPANSSNATGNQPSGIFTNGSTNIAMSAVLHRARQELVRRLIEMTTTRGNVFTVYAIGQAIYQTTTNGTTNTHVLATQQLRVTFKLVPKTSTGDLFHPGTDNSGNPFLFDPTQNADVAKRFSKPDHYDIQVLSVTSGSS